MTDQEMADALRAKGWRIKEPLTQDNCEHPQHMTIGSAWMGSDGSSFSEWCCRKCGKSSSFKTPSNPKRDNFYCWN